MVVRVVCVWLPNMGLSARTHIPARLPGRFLLRWSLVPTIWSRPNIEFDPAVAVRLLCSGIIQGTGVGTVAHAHKHGRLVSQLSIFWNDRLAWLSIQRNEAKVNARTPTFCCAASSLRSFKRTLGSYSRGFCGSGCTAGEQCAARIRGRQLLGCSAWETCCAGAGQEHWHSQSRSLAPFRQLRA